ncbi:DUF4153 domain-containing protein [Bacteroidota bacterium]
MIEQIKENLKNPEELEKLYHADKKAFNVAFQSLYPEISDSDIAGYWKARLDYGESLVKKSKPQRWGIFSLIISCIVAAFLIKLPDIFNFNENDTLFYFKNTGIIVFFGLSLYAIFTNKKINKRNLIITAIAFLIPVIYINLLPSDINSHSIILAYIHLPLLMWCIYGLVYIDFNKSDLVKRIDYIKYNGDLAILYALIAITGMILTGVTIQLFIAIDFDISNIYMNYIVICGAVAAPIVATYIMERYSVITNKIAPIIAKIFSPLVLITLIIYLIVIAVTGKDPYNDREFLLVFNVMLLAVMAIIIYSVSGTSKESNNRFNNIQLFILTIVTLIIDLIALSAILYRLNEFGISPNKIAVLGSNLLIFGNLVLIMIDLFKVNFKNSETEKVELTISKYIPLYLLWIIIVVFAFPFIFGMK